MSNALIRSERTLLEVLPQATIRCCRASEASRMRRREFIAGLPRLHSHTAWTHCCRRRSNYFALRERYWITSSAMANSVSGMVRPSAPRTRRHSISSSRRVGVIAAKDLNRSLPTFEPVSVREREFRWEKVWRGQRPGRHFWRHRPIPGGRDRAIPRLRRQSRGKSKTIPTAPGKRNLRRTAWWRRQS